MNNDITFDDRSERNLKTLLPGAERAARKFLAAVRAAGIDARIISGTRTYAEQQALFDQGRTKPGPRVTNARPGQSNHNFGIAWDIGIFSDSSDYLEDSPLYRKAGAIGKAMGLDWGGDWAKIRDEPHFEVKTGLSMAQKRERVAKGIPLLPDDPDVWTLHLNGKLLGEMRAPGDGYLYYPARALLNRLYGEAVVLRSLNVDKGRNVLTWNGEGTGVPVIYNEQGSALAQIGPLAEWVALTAVWDDKARTIRLSRS